MVIDKAPQGGGVIKLIWAEIQYSVTFAVEK